MNLRDSKCPLIQYLGAHPPWAFHINSGQFFSLSLPFPVTHMCENSTCKKRKTSVCPIFSWPSPSPSPAQSLTRLCLIPSLSFIDPQFFSPLSFRAFFISMHPSSIYSSTSKNFSFFLLSPPSSSWSCGLRGKNPDDACVSQKPDACTSVRNIPYITCGLRSLTTTLFPCHHCLLPLKIIPKCVFMGDHNISLFCCFLYQYVVKWCLPGPVHIIINWGGWVFFSADRTRTHTTSWFPD